MSVPLEPGDLMAEKGRDQGWPCPALLLIPDSHSRLKNLFLLWRERKKSFSQGTDFNKHALILPPAPHLLFPPPNYKKSIRSLIKDQKRLASPQGRDIAPEPCVQSAHLSFHHGLLSSHPQSS